MGKEKAGFLTPKAIGNRIKAKGLQKLRWYCQMCEKQCRDENGFKCHCESASHLRQMRVFADNPGHFVDDFSRDFLKNFMRLVSTRYKTIRVLANNVYKDYIADKQHTHMNATRWQTLSGFCQWAGKVGLLEIDPAPDGKGWYIKYIDRDPKVIARQKELEKKDNHDRSDEARTRAFVEELVRQEEERKRLAGGGDEEPDYTVLLRDEDGPKVKLELSGRVAPDGAIVTKRKRAFGDDDDEEDEEAADEDDDDDEDGDGGDGDGGDDAAPAAAPAGARDDGREPAAKRARADDGERVVKSEAVPVADGEEEGWLRAGGVVKVVHKTLGDGKYYKEKGTVQSTEENGTVCKIKMHATRHLLRLHQKFLETVIPKPGGAVVFVKGPRRGASATMLAIDMDNFKATVRVESGPDRGNEVAVEYEEITRLATDDEK